MVVNQHHPTQFHMHDRGSERERERDLYRYRHTDKDRDSKGIPNWQTRQIIAKSLLPQTAHSRSYRSTCNQRSKLQPGSREEKRGESSAAGSTTADSVSEMSNMSDFHQRP